MVYGIRDVLGHHSVSFYRLINMLLLLPIFTLWGLASTLVLWGAAKGHRCAFLLAASLLGAGVIVFTEILSVFRCITPLAISIFWIVLIVLSCGAMVRCLCCGKRMPGISWPAVQGARWEVGLLIAGLVFVVGTFFVGSISAPNNWDSMTYHLARVMHWLQNHSLAYYPTNIGRQNSYLPGAEIMLLHSFILGGGDRWVYCVQWFSFVGCALGVSLIAQRLGVGVRGQILAGVFALTLPMAILQAMTTQNDLLLSFWVVCSVFFILELTERWSFWSLVGAGASLGLATVTKGTFFILGPFLVLGLFQIVRARQIQRAGIFLAVMCLSAFLIAGGHRHREIGANKDVRTPERANLFMARQDPAAMMSNIVRNLASEVTLPATEFNKGLDSFVEKLHRLLGISPADLRTTAGGEFTLPVAKLSFHEDYAGNPVHVFWGLVALGGVFFFSLGGRMSGFILAWAGAAVCFVLMIKWQLWVNRFHVPLFMLAAPLIGLVAEKMRRVMVPFALVAVLYGIAVILCNVRHPFWGEINIFSDRMAQIFVERTFLAKPYLLAVDGLQQVGCHDVGLVMGVDDWEYPLWALTRKEKIVFRHLDVKGHSDVGTPPCAVINTLDPAGAKVRVWAGAPFVRVFGYSDLAIYVYARPQ